MPLPLPLQFIIAMVAHAINQRMVRQLDYLLEEVRVVREGMTASESRLWACINRRQLGVQFRCQVVVGKFIADFLAVEADLIVEVDGPCHQQHRSADARRDAKLGRLGYRVLRLEARLVMEQLPVAVARVREALAHR